MQEPYFLFTNKIHNNRIIEFFDHHFKHQQLLHFVNYKSLGRGHLTEKQKNGSQIIYLSFKRRLFEADRSISFLLTLSTKLIHKQKISFREIAVERFEALFSHIVGHNDNTAFQIRPVLVSVLRRKVNQHL